MIDFLKRWFGKKEEEINFSNLNTWLAQNIEISFATEVKEFKDALVQLDTAIRNLEDFDTDTLDAGAKFKNRLAGNKKAYITALKHFHQSCKVPDKLDSQSLEKYFEEFNQDIQKFNKKTIKNYHILKTLVGEDLEEVVKGVKRVADSVKKIDTAKKRYNLSTIEDIHKAVTEANNSLLGNSDVSKRTKEIHKEKESLIQKESTIQKQIESLKNSREFTNYTKLKLDLTQLVKEREVLRSNMLSKIIALERPLRKYSKISTRSKQIDKFLTLKDTFIRSDQSKVLEILDKFEQTINQKKLAVKSSKKVILSIGSLREAASSYPQKIDGLEQVIDMTQDLIVQNKYEQKLQDLIKKLDATIKALGKISDEEDRLETRDIKKDILFIEKALKRIGHSVKIHDDTMDKKIPA